MKLRILNFGIPAEHDQITRLDSILSDLSFNDFDAFVFDPDVVAKMLRGLGKVADDRANRIEDPSGSLRSTLYRHAREVLELIWSKGGAVICVLRDDTFRLEARYLTMSGKTTSDDFGPYFLLDRAFSTGGKKKIFESIVHGMGNQIRFESGTLPSYLRILKGKLHFEATLAPACADELTATFAKDSVGRIVSAEIKIGAGSVLLVPVPGEYNPSRVGAALVQSVRELISKDVPDVAPPWVEEITVPGANSHDNEIEALREQQLQFAAQADALADAKAELLRHRYLLYTTGKHILEPAVRRAFRTIGYEVLEPDSYEGEWDLEMRDRNGKLLIGEIEGPEGAVDLDKFRQALDYHNDKLLAGEENKGLLVGNAHRLTPVGERPDPFTEHAMKGAVRTGMALIPTPSLFNAVCAVLLDDSEKLKVQIQDSIEACKGVWIWPPSDSSLSKAEPKDNDVSDNNQLEISRSSAQARPDDKT